MWTLYKKEIVAFFSSLTGYVVILVFLLINSAFIWIFPSPINVIKAGYSTLETLFSISPWVFLFLVPAITMRMVSEEKRSGTLDLLFTRPVSKMQIILSKFLASWTLVILSLLPTLVWLWVIWMIGSPRGNIDIGGTWGSYIGLLFLGGVYAAIGIFASSLSKNQILSFILAVLICILLYKGFDFFGIGADSGKIALALSRLGIASHFDSMGSGVLDSRDILYFLLVIILFLTGTRIVLQVRQKGKTWYLLEMGVLLTVIISLALLSGLKFYRLDLSSGKRFHISQVTKHKLSSLENPLYMRIYLDGEMPKEFVSFRNDIQDLMHEFKFYAGDQLEFEFINIYDEEDPELRNLKIGELYDQGLKVVSVREENRDGVNSTRIIFPGALLSSGKYTIPVNFLKNNPAFSHEVNLNNSVRALEYELMRAIHSITLKEVPKVAFIEGHGELDSLQTYSLMNEMKNFFQVDRGRINGRLDALLDYEALIVARPTLAYNEADKFAIDQYIMQGGKVLFFLDPVNPFADSLSGGTTVALANQTGLEEQLFKYGLRLNYDLVSDLQCAPVPVNVATNVEEPRFELVPWVYLPLLSGSDQHAVSMDLNYVKGAYISSIDTLAKDDKLKSTVLLSTSSSSHKRDVPLYISMEEIMRPPDRALYSSAGIPVAVLMEGIFTSFFKNYPVPAGVSPASAEVRPQSIPTSVLLVSDGDIPANEISNENGFWTPSPLGYDSYTRQTYGNLEFIMNAINHMTDDTGLMELRSSGLKARKLDPAVTEYRKTALIWKLIAILVPISLTLLAGLAIHFFRTRKFR